MSTSESSRSPRRFLDPERIQLARMRRGITKAELAQRLSVTPRTVAKYESGLAPLGVAHTLEEVLGFPAAYFERGGAPELVAAEVRFRAARRTTARERDAAVAVGVSGVEIDRWISTRFVLPPVDVPSFAGDNPRTAASLLRGVWGLGTKPLPNLVQLCESRGVRVYGLPPFADAVDAYSIWRHDTPYVFLARRKTPERLRFDLAHELGHLVLHAGETCETTAQEREADTFASEFLMPAAGLTEYLRPNPSVHELLAAREKFKVSAMALAYSAHKAGRLSDWSYRQMCIELSARGFRTAEPGGMPTYEMSRVFPQILNRSSSARVDARLIATELNLPLSDVHALTFGTELHPAQTTEVTSDTTRRQPTGRHLHAV
ncbi:XRE family transcriptional regulator [Nocardia sp. BMG51109]|uniref:XRE family transcriptional regulator n=1 Tax=Nocardia sp. BMG51109 TaxID=1056816 RepID=UPI00210140F6|nr:XRE family transcriptional regulator [Nocardia sp. BMG51109]